MIDYGDTEAQRRVFCTKTRECEIVVHLGSQKIEEALQHLEKVVSIFSPSLRGDFLSQMIRTWDSFRWLLGCCSLLEIRNGGDSNPQDKNADSSEQGDAVDVVGCGVNDPSTEAKQSVGDSVGAPHDQRNNENYRETACDV